MATGISGELHRWCPSLDGTGNGTTTLYDLQGSADGTLTDMDAGSDWVADTDNGGVRALDYDGSNDYINVSGGAWLTTAMSVSLWIKGASQTDRRFFCAGSSSSTTPIYTLGTNLTKLRFFVRTDAGVTSLDASSTTTLFDSAWHHLVVIDNNGTCAVYIDGSLDATSFNYTRGTMTFNRLSIGALLRSTSALFFAGRIDDVIVFNTNISSGDVATLYDSGNGRGYDAIGGGSILLPMILAHSKFGGHR